MRFLPAATAALLLASAPAWAADATMGQTMDQAMDQKMGQAMDKGKMMEKGARTDMHAMEQKGMDHKGMMMGMHNADDLKWGDAPPALPKGAKVAILDGDPFKPGPYVIRLKMPPGYKVPPHWHARTENVTVISGMLFLGMGDKLDEKAAKMLKPGGFHAIGPEVHHYAFSKSGAVVQIHGEGPFNITYINPADNPDPAAKK